MKHFLSSLLILYTALSLSVRPAASQGTWHPAAAPLTTRWAKEVSPDRVRPEYPRPLLVRKEWKSLNGMWQFAFDDRNEGSASGWSSGKDLPSRILVPFTFEAALSGIGKGKEIHERVWYRRKFTVPSAWNGKRLLLNFGACDWDTTVFVNGHEVAHHVGGYTPFSADITEAIKPGAEQEVVVAVYDPADPSAEGWQPKGKQLGSEGIWYTRTTGIWQTVWIEPVADYHIARLSVTPQVGGDGASGDLEIHVETAGGGSARSAELTLEAGISGQTVRATVRSNGGRLDSPTVKIHIEGAALWTPETPNLYGLKLTLKQDGRIVDMVNSYTALREVGIANGRLMLNGKPYFYRGVLDQGFWPDGIYTPPSDSAIRADVETIKKLGFNMARKHVKVEDPRYYYWCDRLGVAVWQDMPSSHNLKTAAARENFEREWREEIDTLRAYPCVVHWIPFNENWGDPGAYQDYIVTLTRKLDATRPITDASGWTQRSLTDVIDAHDYGNNLLREGVRSPVKPKVVGEYGGIALPVPNHTWTTGWGYQTVRSADGLVKKVNSQTSQLFAAENLSGFVYTQLTDVEQELNGLLTYDRLPKAVSQRLAAVFEGRDHSAPTSDNYLTRWLVLGPIPAGVSISTSRDEADARATMDTLLARPWLPAEEALDPKADVSVTVDSKAFTWRSITIPDNQIDFHAVFGGQSSNAVAYAVAAFDSPRAVQNATLLFGSDDGAVVWLNGKRIHSISKIRGVNPDEDVVPNISLKAGRNLLVVKVGQGVGGWGLCVRVQLPNGKFLAQSGK